MSDEGIKIAQLTSLPGTFDGSEFFPMSRGGTTYKGTIGDLSNWLVAHLGLNRPPTNVNSSQTTDDTAMSLSGNLLSGAADADGDPIRLQSLVYNGESIDFGGGSFQTTYGVFFLNGTTGDWTFSLGQGARKLNTGDTGQEVFTFSIGDGRGGLSTNTLTLTITGTNSVPVVNYYNGSTQINTSVTGNLIYNYAFDYETTLAVLHYTVAGITGTWAAGVATVISGKGTIGIDSDGTFTFTPVADFTGAIPLITYTLTDGANQVPAYLTLAVTPLPPGSAPIVITTDVVAGPISGGENNKGIYLTLWGQRFGTSGGLGTTTKVYIGGVEVDNYRELIADPGVSTKKPGMQRLTVQVGAIGTPTLGKPLPVTVEVSGQPSNADNIFTPNPGRILFVSLSGNDLTAVPGDITKPYRHLQTPNRGDGGIYPILLAGDTIVIRGGDWSDLGYDTAWFRFRDPQQQGSNPDGNSGTGWMAFIPYPTEDVHYTTPTGGNKGGIQGPGSAFSGTCGDWVVVSKLRMEVVGGSSRDAAPINMQYNTGHWRVIGNQLGPWVAGDSAVLNAACVTGEGNFIVIACNWLHDVGGVAGVLQNHGIYAGTTSYGWHIKHNVFQRMTGGSAIQANDSDGGTGTFQTPFGYWQGFTNFEISHNWIEETAKYGILFADVGAGQGDLSALIWNNILIKTSLPPFRLNTTTTTSDVLYTFNTMYNCMTVSSGTGNAMIRNEGLQQSPGHSVKIWNNIMSFGPDTTPGCQWMYDYSGSSSGYDFKRNLYYQAGQTPTVAPPSSDTLSIVGDPKFTNTGTLDLSLQDSSPCANAGTQSLSGTGLVVNDDYTALATRQYGGAPDIGAMEIGTTLPYTLTAPTMSGGPQIGVASTCSLGSWGNSPTSYSRQFTLNGTPVGSAITGTGTASYTPVAGDERKTLRCEVTATNGDGSTTYTVTSGTVANGAGGPLFTAPPAVTGTAQVGQTLSLSDGTHSGSTTSGNTYRWLRDGTAAISGATANTYTAVTADQGHTLVGEVTLHNSTTGSVIGVSSATSTVAAAPADPTLVQVSTPHTIAANTITDFLLAGAQGGNLLLGFFTMWDQALYNGLLTDSQGHTYSDFTQPGSVHYAGDNPWIGALYVRSNATGDYTFHINPQSTASACGVTMEITGLDPTTIPDIPYDTSQGSSGTPILTASQAVTKPNDLIIVHLAVHAAGLTVTPGTGWTEIPGSHIDGAYMGQWTFYRKLSAVETFAFTATIGDGLTAYGWITQSLVIKGS